MAGDLIFLDCQTCGGCCGDEDESWSITFDDVSAGTCSAFCSLFDNVTYPLDAFVEIAADVWESDTLIEAGPVCCYLYSLIVNTTFCVRFENIRIVVTISGCESGTRLWQVSVRADVELGQATGSVTDCDSCNMGAVSEDEVIGSTGDDIPVDSCEALTAAALTWSGPGATASIIGCNNNNITLFY